MGNLFTESINPATGESLGKTPLTAPDEIKNIVNQAAGVQEKWARVPVGERSKTVLKIRDYLVNNGDRLAEVIAADNGKTRTDAMATEILPAAMAVSYYCKNAKKILRDEKIKGGNIALINKRSYMQKIPHGVVGIISPWNYPFAIAFSEIITALLAGNAVLFKGASETQAVGRELKKCVEFASLPEGLFNYVNLPGKIAGDVFLEAGINKLFFTGSVPVGKYLMAKAAETLTPVVLELGGNDAMIVCADADLERAAAGAVWAGFQNAGQSCGGVERIYCHASIYDEFLRVLKNKTENLRIGYDKDFNIDVGVMTTDKQIDLVNKHIQDALKKGAEVFASSPTAEAADVKNLLPAMVLTNVDHSMELMQHETFGPVVGVMKFSDEDEAIRLANDSYLGLTASVWTKNNRRGKKLASRLNAGVVTVNDHLMSHGMAETSWGGFKQSGIGHTHGKAGFEEMIRKRFVVYDILPMVKKDLWWHPFDRKVYKGIKGVMEMLYGTAVGMRLRGMINLLKIVPRIFRS